MKARINPHTRYRELIAARLERPLTRIELRALNAHLKTCVECQQVEADYRTQRTLVRGLAAPIPPRDLWARTSASLDREVARDFRAMRWSRRLARGRRSTQPSTALMTAIAALGISAALAVLQLAPAFEPTVNGPNRPTPMSVRPEAIAFLGMGLNDAAVYSTQVNQVCPASEPFDCIAGSKLVRTPVILPPTVRAGDLALSPTGRQLALVGHGQGEDIIGVLNMPGDGDGGKANVDGQHSPRSGPTSVPQGSHAPGASAQPGAALDATSSPMTMAGPDGQPALPPPSAVPGLTVLAILEDVESAGSAPQWSLNGEMLAFSAMPVDGSHGPDVYVWSPGEGMATPITADHASYFASWSGNRIVFSRLGDGPRPDNFVIDPGTLEERALAGPQLWLPVVNDQRTQAVGWFGQLVSAGGLPAPRSGALYIMDWSSVDPFGPGARPTEPPTAGPTTLPVATGSPEATGSPNATDSPAATASADANASPDATVFLDRDKDSTTAPSPDNETEQSITPAPETTSAPSSAQPTATETPPEDDADVDSDSIVPDGFVAVDPDRDPRSAPVVDWQVRWSPDGAVLGVWVADSTDSSWGQLTILAADPDATSLPPENDPLLGTTLARRGFSLGDDRVAWVGPSDNNVDGELRLKTWGTAGDGSLRLSGPDQEEVVPAS